VHDEAALKKRVRFVWREFCQPALVEEFISGREFSVSVLATSPSDFTVLAIGEIAYEGLAPGRPQILGYDAKWDDTAPFTQAMAVRCPAALDKKTAERIRRVVLDVAKMVGLRDYGRVDLRLRESDQTLFVLEVNPNPDLNNECVFMQAARASGRTNEGTICEIAERAIERCYERANIVELPAGVKNERRPHPSQTPSRAHSRAEGRRRASSLPLREELLDVKLPGKCCHYGADIDLREQDRILKHTDLIRRLMDESQDRDPQTGSRTRSRRRPPFRPSHHDASAQ